MGDASAGSLDGVLIAGGGSGRSDSVELGSTLGRSGRLLERVDSGGGPTGGGLAFNDG
jgi:hypothetical protein